MSQNTLLAPNGMPLILPTRGDGQEVKPRSKRPSFVRSDVSSPKTRLDTSAIAALAARHPETFMKRMEDLVAQGKLTLGSIVDLKGLWRALRDVKVKAEIDFGDGTRAAVDTSAFPMLMGNLVVDQLNRAYMEVPTIGQDLVEDMESNKKFSHIVKIVNNVGAELGTKENEEFPMISASEQYSVIGYNRKGFQLALSQEVIEENDIGNFLSLVDQGGQFAGELIEEQTLSRVCDQQGSSSGPAEPYSFHPKNVGTQLYNSAANNPGTQAPKGTRVLTNALTSTANLDNLRLVLASMLNTRNRRIAIPLSQCTLLVPDALLSTALHLVRSELEPGVFNQENNWGPKGAFRPSLASSPKLDDISTSAYYLGNFKQQFRRKWKIRLETVSVYSDPMTYARTREAYRTRVCWDVEIGAIDYVFVVQSLSGDATTAPAASSANL